MSCKIPTKFLRKVRRVGSEIPEANPGNKSEKNIPVTKSELDLARDVCTS